MVTSCQLHTFQVYDKGTVVADECNQSALVALDIFEVQSLPVQGLNKLHCRTRAVSQHIIRQNYIGA